MVLLRNNGEILGTVEAPDVAAAKARGRNRGKVRSEMLADMIGTTRSRVSKFMNKFRELGFISYNGTIEVHSSLLGVLLHEDRPRIKRSGEAIDAE